MDVCQPLQRSLHTAHHTLRSHQSIRKSVVHMCTYNWRNCTNKRGGGSTLLCSMESRPDESSSSVHAGTSASGKDPWPCTGGTLRKLIVRFLETCHLCFVACICCEFSSVGRTSSTPTHEGSSSGFVVPEVAAASARSTGNCRTFEGSRMRASDVSRS